VCVREREREREEEREMKRFFECASEKMCMCVCGIKRVNENERR
jgi:hypothetical protein